MALQTQSPTRHNQMLGQRIQHPASTNYEDDFPIPASKRLKRLDSNGSSNSLKNGSDDELEAPASPIPCRREIADSEAESDEEDAPLQSARRTDLESALPPVDTDKEAIRAYEATRAAEAADLSLQGRLGQRKWVQGKSSIYVDAFNLALETVLEDEAHLFDAAEMTVFENWRNLTYEGQYL